MKAIFASFFLFLLSMWLIFIFIYELLSLHYFQQSLS